MLFIVYEKNSISKIPIFSVNSCCCICTLWILCYTVPLYWAVLLYYTELLYWAILLYCTTVLSCTVLYYCTELYCTVLLYWAVLYYLLSATWNVGRYFGYCRHRQEKGLRVDYKSVKRGLGPVISLMILLGINSTITDWGSLPVYLWELF